MRTFFGGKFIEKEKLLEAGIQYPIKLEYYKKSDEENNLRQNRPKYGISIVKTSYMQNDIEIETKEIEFLSNDEVQIEKILKMFKENDVTPVSAEYILTDLSKQEF